MIEFLLLLFPIFTLVVVSKLFEKNKFFKTIISFEKYILLLDYHMSKAYDMIYKDRILVYSLEATRINDIEFQVISKDFALLVFKFLGPKLKKEFINLYGNEETLLFIVMEYFNARFEDDEIRKRAEQNLVDSNLEIPQA